jgi:hypothetical protein
MDKKSAVPSSLTIFRQRACMAAIPAFGEVAPVFPYMTVIKPSRILGLNPRVLHLVPEGKILHLSHDSNSFGEFA